MSFGGCTRSSSGRADAPRYTGPPVITHHEDPRPEISMRIVIVGAGKMGRSLASLAEARGHTIHAMIGGNENAGGRALTAERLKGAEVAVEFTQPDAAVANLERLIGAGVPVVTGTTGWRDQ